MRMLYVKHVVLILEVLPMVAHFVKIKCHLQDFFKMQHLYGDNIFHSTYNIYMELKDMRRNFLLQPG